MAIHWQDCYGKDDWMLGECVYAHRQAQALLFPVRERQTNGSAKSQLSPVRSEFKKLDFTEPKPLIDQVDLGCTHSEIVSEESNVKTKIEKFAKITTTDTEAKSTEKTETRQVVSWSYDMKGLAGKNRGTFSSSLALTSVEQSSKAATHCVDDHPSTNAKLWVISPMHVLKLC